MSSILITGGAGFFGRNFVKRLLEGDKYSRIIVLSRDEAKHALLRDEVGNPDNRMRFVIGDIRSKDRLKQAMAGVDVVAHCAAMKRIETCQSNISELIRTNIVGSQMVVEAAYEAHVRNVVFLSTDKAYLSTSVYGLSKALMEKIFLNANHTYGEHGPKFSGCRFGNVFKSTASVIPRWRKLAEQGPVPVTDPACTRFGMTIEQAMDLVEHTIHTMVGGELNLPRDIPAFLLGDLAEAMGYEMNVIGLPSFEKKHETLADGMCSKDARRMTVEELQVIVSTV